MFKSHYRLRMHDTDMARIIFFVSLFRIAHVVWEEILENAGLSYHGLFHDDSSYAFVIVHAEADYKLSLFVGDRMDIHCFIDKIGNSSFHVRYEFYKEAHRLAATVLLVFATINPKEKTKIPIPDEFRKFLTTI